EVPGPNGVTMLEFAPLLSNAFVRVGRLEVMATVEAMQAALGVEVLLFEQELTVERPHGAAPRGQDDDLLHAAAIEGEIGRPRRALLGRVAHDPAVGSFVEVDPLCQ